MKHRIKTLAALALAALVNLQPAAANAQGTAFTYQGRLNDTNGPATGTYDLTFSLYRTNWAGIFAGPITNTAVGVTNGLFTVTLDFGPTAFDGSPLALEIAVRTNVVGGGGAFTTLTPRQPLTPAPYAIFAGTANSAVSASSLVGGVPLSQLPVSVLTNNANGVNLTGSFSGNGGTLTNLNAATLAGTLSVAQLPASVLTNTATGVTLTGAFSGNGGNLTNLNAATLTGTLSPARLSANVLTNGGSGVNSLAVGYQTTATNSYATALGYFAQAGGTNSLALGSSLASGNRSTALGYGNTASGNRSTAMGQLSYATNNGAFVWADSQNANFYSTSNDQFSVRAQGGVRLVTSGAGLTVDGIPVLTNGAAGILTNGANGVTLTGAFSGNGGGLTNLSAAPLPANVLTNGAIGAHALALGNQTTASGGSSTALGYSTTANGSVATALGDLTTASGTAATALGLTTTASGYASTALGNNTTASGDYSTALGNDASATNTGSFVWADSQGAQFYSTANDQFSVRAQGGVRLVTGGAGLTLDGATVLANGVLQSLAIGFGSTATSSNATALGWFSLASGFQSTALGDGATASAWSATALGTGVMASNTNSTALGNNTTASGFGATALGTWTKAVGDGSTALGEHATASGWESTALGFYPIASGSNSIALGYNTTASGVASAALGCGTVASGYETLAIGYQAKATNVASTALGQNSTASGYDSTALGGGAASGQDSIALGGAIANGEGSIALGYLAKATNDYATALGYHTMAGGTNATALGYDSVASGYASTALGGGTASGESSIALGGSIAFGGTVASGQGSIALGNTVLASGDSAVALGGLTQATGNSSIALGCGYAPNSLVGGVLLAGATASGNSSIALGDLTQAFGDFSTALGNRASAKSNYSTALGYDTLASGIAATALGYGAQATNAGSFVWSDASAAPASSTTDNSLTFRAAGGYRLFTDAGMSAGVSLAPGGAAWASISDQNAKKNFVPVNGEAVLNKLAAVPVQQWNYKWEKDSDVPNIGPMAQAFKAAFYPGRDDKSITTLEFDGVELAAIQGLNQKVEEKDTMIQQQSAEIADLKARLEKLEHVITTLTGGAK